MFGFLKRWFAASSPSDEDESELESVTREEALRIAQSEAIRGFEDRGESISYITYSEQFADYCCCQFTQEAGGWVLSLRTLLPHERLPGEEIQDEQIVELIRRGNTIGAIKLYRTKYEVGLAEAKHAVEAMLEKLF